MDGERNQTRIDTIRVPSMDGEEERERRVPIECVHGALWPGIETLRKRHTSINILTHKTAIVK